MFGPNSRTRLERAYCRGLDPAVPSNIVDPMLGRSGELPTVQYQEVLVQTRHRQLVREAVDELVFSGTGFAGTALSDSLSSCFTMAADLLSSTEHKYTQYL